MGLDLVLEQGQMMLEKEVFVGLVLVLMMVVLAEDLEGRTKCRLKVELGEDLDHDNGLHTTSSDIHHNLKRRDREDQHILASFQ